MDRYAFRGDDDAWIEITDRGVPVPGASVRMAGIEDPFFGVLAYIEQPDAPTLSASYACAISAEEREAKGLVLIVEPEEIPTGVRVLGTELVDIEGVPHRQYLVEAFGFDDARHAKAAAIAAAYAEVIAGGFPHTFSETAETLQVRPNDLTNWLALKDSCNDAITAGQGADLCPLPIRVTSNVEYALTFAQAADLMRDLRTWVAAVLAVFWAKKDLVAAAEDLSDLAAIDPAAGWPS